MSGLPGYDAWKTASPYERSGENCEECGDPIERDDEPIRLEGEGFACSSLCEARWHLKHANTITDRMRLATVAYGEEDDISLGVALRDGTAFIITHLARVLSAPHGEVYMLEDENGKERLIRPSDVEKLEVLP